MSTQKQIDANRRNSTNSTGPRTSEGKAASRLNALKHGVFANSPVIVGEVSAEYKDLTQSYFERFNPATTEEHALVASLVRNAWLLERFCRVETDLWDRRFDHISEFVKDEAHPLARAAEFLHSHLHSLQRRIDSADRAYRRNLELLLKLQAGRQPADTTQNGFVPSDSEKRNSRSARSLPVPPGANPQTPPTPPLAPDGTATGAATRERTNRAD